jgi:2-C-methyl-D-erythritol 4-phosphate cytidylyltransferase
MNKLTVILPAAGKGTRLNLPYPKEILRLNKEKALIIAALISSLVCGLLLDTAPMTKLSNINTLSH